MVVSKNKAVDNLTIQVSSRLDRMFNLIDSRLNDVLDGEVENILLKDFQLNVGSDSPVYKELFKQIFKMYRKAGWVVSFTGCEEGKYTHITFK